MEKVRKNYNLDFKLKKDIFLQTASVQALILVRESLKEMTSDKPLKHYEGFEWKNIYVQDYHKDNLAYTTYYYSQN